MKTRWIKWFLIGMTAVMFTACGSSKNTAQEIAIEKISTYAEHGGTLPEVQDYIDAGVKGITEENLAQINEVVEYLRAEEVDTTEEIQALADDLGIVLPDTTAPVITLKGLSKVSVELGKTYTDAGATAKDDVDANVSITVKGTVNIGVAGVYTLVYIAMDSAGNTATVVRTVRVVARAAADTTAPILVLNGASPQIVIQGNDYVELKAIAIDNRDGDITASIDIKGTVDTTKVGSYIVTYTVSDSAGNSSEAKRTVDVVLPSDTTAPDIVLNGENLQTVIQGNDYMEAGATATDDGDASVPVTIEGIVDTSTVGIYTITYTAQDHTGNKATVSRIVNVVLSDDTTAPVITLNGVNPVVTTIGMTYTDAGATATDDRDGNVAVVTEGTVNTNVPGTYVVLYIATDSAGNVSAKTRSVIVEAIIHHNIVYGEVISPYTGRAWLDRNLGAARVCERLDDVACYGDYYQWGRSVDGHQYVYVLSSSTSIHQATDVSNVGHGDFIIEHSEWASIDADGSIRSANWSAIDGSSVCPVDYRVPTIMEIRAETIDASIPVANNANAYSSFLKLPSAGNRYGNDGVIYGQDDNVYIWSSIPSSSNTFRSDYFFANPVFALANAESRATGMPVRCIKD